MVLKDFSECAAGMGLIPRRHFTQVADAPKLF